MRPINIKICAFGPYKDEVYIDFTKFYDNGIFLITGDTGSGKTTIFDAICFALFGSASGVNRDKSSFRSDFASDEVKTYVELEFSHKDCIYKIERCPSYMRKKKRGEGNTLVSGDATLIYLDKVITGEKNVTDKCVEILGINYSQFKQISMIAQGEFLKLLLAKSSDRADIFRRIFDTGIYKEISDRLKKKYLDVKREYEDELLSLSTLRNSVIWDRDVAQDIGISEFLELLFSEIDIDKKSEDKLGVNKTGILNKIQNITSKIDNANEINSNFDKYETIKKEREDKLRNNVDIKRECVSKNKDIYDFIVPLYDELVRCKKMIEVKNRELVNNKKKLDDVCGEYNKILIEYDKKDLVDDNISKLKIDLSELEKKLPIFLEIDNLELKLDELENIYNLLKIDELGLLVNKIRENKIISDKYKNISKDFFEVKDKYNKLNRDYNVMYNKFISCQAGVLALNLVDGDACPVCGSLEHPNKAVISLEVVTKEDLDLSKDKVDICQNELDVLSNKVSFLGKELEISSKDVEGLDLVLIEQDISKYQKLVTSNIDVSSYNINDVLADISYIKASIDNKKSLINDKIIREELEDKINNIKVEIVGLENYVTNFNKRYEEITNEKVRLESVINVLEKEIFEFEKQFKGINNEYVNRYKEFGYDSEDEYLTVKLGKDIYSSYQREIESYDKELLELNSKIKAIGELIEGKERIDIDALIIEKQVMNKELSAIELSLKNVHSKINNNKLVYDKIKFVDKKVGKVEKSLSLYEDLSNTANGNIKGKNKLEFEQYVQAYYFDNVLESANKRFSYMTDSRYLLVRKTESSKVSDKLGLELEVIDNYTGKKRDVSSLSGGESFKAALSISLGISDVVQSYAGGIVIEAMFIDEGFGSLDSESLEQAMNAISMLSNDNSLIGIISHVTELKDRIDKKIVVKKSNSGSSVNVVV